MEGSLRIQQTRNTNKPENLCQAVLFSKHHPLVVAVLIFGGKKIFGWKKMPGYSSIIDDMMMYLNLPS